MKGILLSFPFNNFSESGDINGLRPIKIKKFALLSEVASSRLGPTFRSPVQGGFDPFISPAAIGPSIDDRVRHRR
jgi:hypothetical protein